MSGREDTFLKIGLGTLIGVILGHVLSLLVRKGESSVHVLPVPYTPPHEPEVKPETVKSEPILLTANPVPVVNGRRYRVILMVGFPASLAATPELVRRQAQELGFTDVKVSRERPSDFPGSRRGDFYVDGKWGAGGATMARPSIPSISVVEVWEG